METKRRGRPRRTPDPGERFPLSFRVTPELKEQLELAVARSGKSVAQEAEQRIEASFNEERQFIDALDMMLGQQLSGLVTLLIHVWRDISLIAPAINQVIGGRPPWDPGLNWVCDPFTYDQMAQATNVILEALRPTGERVPPHLLEPQIINGVDTHEVARKIPGLVVMAYLKSLSEDPSSSISHSKKISEGIREKLGPEIVARLKRGSP